MRRQDAKIGAAGAATNGEMDHLAATVQQLKASLSAHGWARLNLAPAPDALPLEDLEAKIMCISEMLGAPVPQSHRGQLISRIQDEGRNYGDHATRGHQTNAELAFHSDRCDLILLFYVSAAAEGGELSVVAYEEAAEALRMEDEPAWRTLFEGFPFDLREERIFASLRWHWRPVLWRTPVGVRGHYIRRFITDCRRHEDAPPLTKAQLGALDAFDAVLARLRPSATFAPRPGDLVVLDNYRVMHARRAYLEGPGVRRLALRTWIAPSESEQLPVFLHPLAGACGAGVYRGGVGVGADYHARLGRPVAQSEFSS